MKGLGMRSCSPIPEFSWGSRLPCGDSLGMEDRESEPAQVSEKGEGLKLPAQALQGD